MNITEVTFIIGFLSMLGLTFWRIHIAMKGSDVFIQNAMGSEGNGKSKSPVDVLRMAFLSFIGVLFSLFMMMMALFSDISTLLYSFLFRITWILVPLNGILLFIILMLYLKQQVERHAPMKAKGV